METGILDGGDLQHPDADCLEACRIAGGSLVEGARKVRLVSGRASKSTVARQQPTVANPDSIEVDHRLEAGLLAGCDLLEEGLAAQEAGFAGSEEGEADVVE